MSEHFILQTIWRDHDTLRLLVESHGQDWRLCKREVLPGELPIESALNFAERVFGAESVCTLWKLGQINTDDSSTHIFCLDGDTLDSFSGSSPSSNMLWISEQEFYLRLPKHLMPFLEKIRHAYKVSSQIKAPS